MLRLNYNTDLACLYSWIVCVYSSSAAVRLLMSHCVGSQCGSTWWLCSLLTKTTANLNPFVLNDLCFGLSIFLSFLPWFHSLRQWLLHGCFSFVSKFHWNNWLSGLVFTRTYVKICWLKEALTQWCRNLIFFSIENWWNLLLHTFFFLINEKRQTCWIFGLNEFLSTFFGVQLSQHYSEFCFN